MSSNNSANHSTERPDVYTVYPGEIQGNTNYGFHPNHFQTPPPKYEDVISGGKSHIEHNLFPSPSPPLLLTGTSLPPEHLQEGTTGVILVAPAYKYTAAQKTFGLIFTIIFMVVFTSILIKIFGST